MGPRILTRQQRALAMGTALLGSVLPVLIVVVDDYRDAPTTFFAGAVLAALAPFGAILSPPHVRWLRWPFAFGGLPGLTLLQAETGGVASPYAILLVMGMMWFGLMASDRELVAGLVVTVACCFAPMLVVGAPSYPMDVGHALALVLVNCSVMLGMAASTRQTARLTERLRHDATHDRLTGLLNRRGWDDVVERRLASAPTTAVFALLDLDHLKTVNDTMGHDGGDRVLRGTADRLAEGFGDGATVARLGGDEFAVLVLGTDAEQVVARLDAVREGAPADAGFSGGVSAISAGDTPSEAMRRADLALYEAKATGRHRTCVASGPMDERLRALPVELR